MKQMLTVWMLGICTAVAAQTPSVPKNLPLPSKGGNLPTPKPVLAKPDLQVVSVQVIAVEPQTDPNLVRIRLSVTCKNAGGTSTGGTFDLELLGFRAALTGGATSIESYQLALNNGRAALAAGQVKTEEWAFIKDKTRMPAGGNQCMLIIDYNNKIAESNETNNKSALFTITIPH
ncbi:MAG: hypothetical protein JST86_17095 [Bacteroidetes bacterium]|nr:hypothetical protein [Bacteroidota bacterium]